LRRILAMLDAAQEAKDMALPGFNLHPLKGKLKGHWSVSVNGNWRVIWRFRGVDAEVVDYLDYH
jgi:proteic killer suppression protein